VQPRGARCRHKKPGSQVGSTPNECRFPGELGTDYLDTSLVNMERPAADSQLSRVTLRRAESSGCRPRRETGSRRTTGNGHLRRVVVEAAWAYINTGHLARRQKDLAISEEAKPIAWKAQHRLHKRYKGMAARGKNKNTGTRAGCWAVIGPAVPRAKGELPFGNPHSSFNAALSSPAGTLHGRRKKAKGRLPSWRRKAGLKTKPLKS